ncbi:MAG: NAD(P)/FAD-dependent oxidoreductase [Symploca sp. SIO1C2]|nr:NAD(P)/FAD-dependent oxidoreductase [Symploca sp. SIO1C2]
MTISNKLADSHKTVAVIGGGPAGMSCALWLKQLGLFPILIEKDQKLGGLQQASHFQNVWYLGLSGHTGYELADIFQQHIVAENLTILFASQLKGIIKAGEYFKIVTKSDEFTARSMVIATGQRIKGYEDIKSVPGSHDLLSSQRVCFNPGATPLLIDKLDKQVVGIVGGGDNGLVTAIRLANTAQHIHLFVRSQLRGFALNQQEIFKLIEAGKVTLHQLATIDQFEVSQENISITFQDEKQQHNQLILDYICFRIGFAPNAKDIVQLLEQGKVGALELSQGGYITTDQFLRTSIPNIYAAGDVTNPRDPCVATAVAQGAIAARSLDEDLKNSN